MSAVSFRESVTTNVIKLVIMKNFILVAFLLVGITGSLQAQEIKVLPTNHETNSWPDGWHKFQLQGVTFDVEILNGRYTQGNVIWFDGTTYSGSLSGAFISGRGTYTWPNGMRYEGSFKKGNRHGKGSLILTNGQKWSGKWKENKKNGKGKIFNQEGTLVEQGVWEDDVMVGEKK